MSTTNQKQLGNTLWSIADPLRGAMDADDFRDSTMTFFLPWCLSQRSRIVGQGTLDA